MLGFTEAPGARLIVANESQLQVYTHQQTQETHLWGPGCIQDQIGQLSEQFVKGVFHVAAGQNGPAQVSQQPGGELPLAGFGFQRQRYSQRGHLAPHGPQVQFCKQLLDVERDVNLARA